LTEEQYKTLCATCDSVLVADGATFERIAIPWLHVLREHPVFLSQYENLFIPRSPLKRLFDHGRRVVVNVALWFRLAWRVARSSGKLWYGDLPKCASVDVVFVSHLLALPQLATEDDFYFGKVPAELARQGKSVLLVLINHTAAIGDELERSLEVSPIPRVVISSGLSPKEEFRIWRRAMKEASRLRHAAGIEKAGLRKTILRQASIEVTANNTKTSLRISRVVGEVVSRCQAKSVVTTYEGHAWERLVYAAARDARPDVACVGYQHAALFRLQHAAKRSLGKKYDPALILAAGPVGLKQLQNASNLPGIPLGILGSNRSIKDVSRNDSTTCLVLPEGIVEECRILFTFSLSCARACPEVRFIWRLHPIMSFDKLVRRVPVLGSLPSNIEISAQTFEEDIARSSWALYRGSTAVVTAAANGVTPIYLEQPGELSIDPLFEISGHHPTVGNVEQFILALESANRDSELVAYCRTFYGPLNSGALAPLWI
jgi:hypothetical protein